MPAHLALSYDPVTRRADVAFPPVLDTTPATPAIMSLLCDRRARPDDTLPLEEAPVLQPDVLNPRRGWWADALDPEGQRCGSRLWLLIRAKQTERTRRLAELYAREALAWASPQGLTVAADWVRDGVLVYVCRFGSDQLVLERTAA